jgi:hypothetical protein
VSDRTIRQHSHHATRGIAAADAEIHAATGDLVERRQGRSGDGDVACRGIRDAGAEAQAGGCGTDQGQERIGISPQHVRVEHPAIAEAVRLGPFRQVDAARMGVIRLERDPELHP